LLLDTKPALAAIEQYRRHDYATCVLAFAAAARLADYRGDRDDTNRQLASAITTFGFFVAFAIHWLEG
jgi:hypothetical protein